MIVKSDKEIAADINLTINELNARLASAVQDGIVIELDIVHLVQLGGQSTPQIQIELSRKL